MRAWAGAIGIACVLAACGGGNSLSGNFVWSNPNQDDDSGITIVVSKYAWESDQASSPDALVMTQEWQSPVDALSPVLQAQLQRLDVLAHSQVLNKSQSCESNVPETAVWYELRLSSANSTALYGALAGACDVPLSAEANLDGWLDPDAVADFATQLAKEVS